MNTPTAELLSQTLTSKPCAVWMCSFPLEPTALAQRSRVQSLCTPNGAADFGHRSVGAGTLIHSHQCPSCCFNAVFIQCTKVPGVPGCCKPKESQHVVMQSCRPSTWKVEIDRSERVHSQLHSELKASLGYIRLRWGVCLCVCFPSSSQFFKRGTK